MKLKIDNPFIWKTKVEVVRELKDWPEGNLIRRTLSCSRTRDMSSYKPHCGKCAQCLQRRLSTLGARASELDPAEAYAVDLLTGPRQSGNDRVMAVETMRSALEFRRMTDAEFATRFAGELAWLTNSFPGQAPSEVARNIIDMFRRHGEFVRAVFMQAASDHAGNLIDHTLPDSCLLRIAISAPGMEFDSTPFMSVPQENLPDRCDTGHEVITDGDQIVLAVDGVEKRILIDGLGPLTAPTDYRIVSVLVELFREDRGAELAPENFRTLLASEIAQKASLAGDEAARKAISRLREKIDREHQELYGSTLGQDAVIENVWGKGYRINPSVRIVSPSELRSR